MGNNGLLGLLGGSGGAALLAILYWVLRRTDRALERSNSAITMTNQNAKFAGQNMQLVLALREAIFKQGTALDAWEDWASDVRSNHRRMQQHLVEKGALDSIEELPTPPGHLDLGPLFRNLPEFGAGSASGGEDPAPPGPAAADRTMMDRLFGNG